MADKLEAAMHGGATWTDAEREALLQVLHDDQCPIPHPVSTKPLCLYALQNEEFSQDLLDALLPHLAARVAEAERAAGQSYIEQHQSPVIRVESPDDLKPFMRNALAEAERAGAARALREAADDAPADAYMQITNPDDEDDWSEAHLADWLRDRADAEGGEPRG